MTCDGLLLLVGSSAAATDIDLLGTEFPFSFLLVVIAVFIEVLTTNIGRSSFDSSDMGVKEGCFDDKLQLGSGRWIVLVLVL